MLTEWRGTVATVALVAGLCLTPAQAGEVPQESTWGSPRALVSASALNVRAEPSLDAAVVARLPRAWPVAILDDTGPTEFIAGRPDRWIHVSTFRCTDDACQTFEAGWVADSYLAVDDRFEPLEDAPSGVVAGHDSRSVFAYEIAASGAFTRWRMPCQAAACDVRHDITPSCDDAGEIPLGGTCVLTGTLHRHRDLVRGRSQQGDWLDRQNVQLFVDDAGALCAFGHGRHAAGRCTAAVSEGRYDRDPVGTIARLAAGRRQRLAFTAAPSLNLRSAPALSADIIARLPRASVVERVSEAELPVILNGRHDRWVQVEVIECAGHAGCRVEAAGWAMESFLAYEDRLTPVTAWPQVEVSGNQAFGFEVAADGTFRRWEACGTGREGLEICSHTGRLYRYRDLLVLKDDGGSVHSAYLATAGNLCLISSGMRLQDGRHCDS